MHYLERYRFWRIILLSVFIISTPPAYLLSETSKPEIYIKAFCSLTFLASFVILLVWSRLVLYRLGRNLFFLVGAPVSFFIFLIGEMLLGTNLFMFYVIAAITLSSCALIYENNAKAVNKAINEMKEESKQQPSEKGA